MVGVGFLVFRAGFVGVWDGIQEVWFIWRSDGAEEKGGGSCGDVKIFSIVDC